MNTEEENLNIENKGYWNSVEIKFVGEIQFLRFKHYSEKGFQFFTINFDQIKGVRKTFDENRRSFIEIITDEKLLTFIDDSVRLAYTYNYPDKILKLIFPIDTEVGKFLNDVF